MKFRITCKEAVDFISKKEEKKLSILQRFQLMRHLAVCSLCRLFEKQNKTMISSFSKPTGEQNNFLTPEEKEDIIKTMQEAQE